VRKLEKRKLEKRKLELREQQTADDGNDRREMAGVG
jgi:hypothetical protein